MDTKAYPYCYTYSNMGIIGAGRSTAGLNARSLERRSNKYSQRDAIRLQRRSANDTAPCPTKCGTVDEKTGYQNPPCDDDRQDLMNLRFVKPTPEWWCKQNNMNVTEIRKYEAGHSKFVHDLNDVSGYVSPSALYNRPALLGELVKRGQTEFYTYDDMKKKVVMPCVTELAKNPEKAVETLRSAAEKIYKVLDYDKVVGKLRDVFGQSAADSLVAYGKKFANKPYTELKSLVEDFSEDYCDVYDEDDE